MQRNTCVACQFKSRGALILQPSQNPGGIDIIRAALIPMGAMKRDQSLVSMWVYLWQDTKLGLIWEAVQEASSSCSSFDRG